MRVATIYILTAQILANIWECVVNFGKEVGSLAKTCYINARSHNGGGVMEN